MSYTRTWSTAIPAGSDQASTIDDSIRALRVDIQERMDTLTNSTWSSDPAGGPLTSVLYFPPSIMSSFDSTGNNNIWFGDPSAGYFTNGVGVARTGNFPIPTLPVGVTITKIEALIYLGTGKAIASMQISNVYLTNLVTAAGTGAIGTAAVGSGTVSATANSTYQWLDAGISSHAIVAGDVYTLKLATNSAVAGDGRFAGARVTYTRPAPWNCY